MAGTHRLWWLRENPSFLVCGNLPYLYSHDHKHCPHPHPHPSWRHALQAWRPGHSPYIKKLSSDLRTFPVTLGMKPCPVPVVCRALRDPASAHLPHLICTISTFPSLFSSRNSLRHPSPSLPPTSRPLLCHSLFRHCLLLLLHRPLPIWPLCCARTVPSAPPSLDVLSRMGCPRVTSNCCAPVEWHSHSTPLTVADDLLLLYCLYAPAECELWESRGLTVSDLTPRPRTMPGIREVAQ